MALKRSGIIRNPIVLGAAGIALAAALFSGGAFTGRALADDAPSPSPTRAQVIPGIANDGNRAGLAGLSTGGSPDSTTSSGNASAPGTMPAYPCQGGDISAVVSGTTIDPAKAGLTPRFLTTGFKLQNLSLSPYGGCLQPGMPEKATPVLNTSWLHDGTSAHVNVSQRIAAEPVTNVLMPGTAQFWSGGYAFMVNASPMAVPPEKPMAPADSGSISSSGASSGSGAAVAPAIAPGEPYPGGDATATLEAVIAQLAPDISLQCFYRQVSGTWSDLAGLGIGDPRSAIPAGFAQSSLNVRTFTPPSGGCATSVVPTEQSGFDASFVRNGANGSFDGGIFINANGFHDSNSAMVGHLDAYSAYWSNGKYSFSIGAKSNEPIGRDAIRAIALAIDPAFDSACMAITSTITDADARAAGFHTPTLPGGYKLESSQLQHTALSSTCSGKPAGEQAGYSLQWTLRDGAAVINASATRFAGQPGEPGWISSHGLSWTGADGTHFGVYGYTEGKDATVSQDDLIAVAKSLDPALDPSKLSKQPDGGGKPEPMPAPAMR